MAATSFPKCDFVVAMAQPPYIKLENISPTIPQRIGEALGETAIGYAQVADRLGKKVIESTVKSSIQISSENGLEVTHTNDSTFKKYCQDYHLVVQASVLEEKDPIHSAKILQVQTHRDEEIHEATHQVLSKLSLHPSYHKTYTFDKTAYFAWEANIKEPLQIDLCIKYVQASQRQHVQKSSENEPLQISIEVLARNVEDDSIKIISMDTPTPESHETNNNILTIAESWIRTHFGKEMRKVCEEKKLSVSYKNLALCCSSILSAAQASHQTQSLDSLWGNHKPKEVGVDALFPIVQKIFLQHPNAIAIGKKLTQKPMV